MEYQTITALGDLAKSLATLLGVAWASGVASMSASATELSSATLPSPVAGNSRSIVESTSVVPSCELATYGIPEPQMVPPIVHVGDFGAKGDGVTDDSAAINKAIESMDRGGTLVFESGRTYLKRNHIYVKQPGVRLWGYGAVLYSHVTDEQVKADRGPGPGKNAAKISVQLWAPRTSVYGLTFVSNLRKRLVGTSAHTALYLTSEQHEVIDNRFEYTQNGVRVRGASRKSSDLVSWARDFVVARNVIYRTTADAIMVTTHSRDGRILCNVVRENGDDMVSVLDYGLGEPDQVENILIEGNDVSGTYWGRGIAVHGGRDVTIRNNSISATPHAAGIMIRGGPDAYKMANVRNVLVEGNRISEVQTTEPTYNPLSNWKRTGHAAIDIRGYGAVGDILVKSNTIVGAARVGILVKGHATSVGLVGNRMSRVHGEPIKIQALDGNVACADNTYENTRADNALCSGHIPVVKGASM